MVLDLGLDLRAIAQLCSPRTSLCFSAQFIQPLSQLQVVPHYFLKFALSFDSLSFAGAGRFQERFIVFANRSLGGLGLHLNLPFECPREVVRLLPLSAHNISLKLSQFGANLE